MEELVYAPRQLPLRPAGETLLGERGEHPVGDRGGLARRLDLGGLLHRPQPLDETLPWHGLDPAFRQRLVTCDREDVRLDSDRPAGEPRGEIGDHRTRRLLETDPIEGLRLLRVAEVREERRLSVRVDEQGGIRAREPGQVADVDATRHEQRLVEERGELLDPAQLRPARNAIAVR